MRVVARAGLVSVVVGAVLAITGAQPWAQGRRPAPFRWAGQEHGSWTRDRSAGRPNTPGRLETKGTILDGGVSLIGRWPRGPCYGVAAVGNTAYFGNGGYLEVVDFSGPADPVELGRVPTPSVVKDVAVAAGCAHVAAGWSVLPRELRT